ncbi:MAG: RluA family pseudouridine synthase [Clostridia bacterium]|nr:RluA family pseudouridine synthase [Clostridia bacterium]
MIFIDSSAGRIGILYEDENVICAVKPAGLLSEGTGDEKTFIDCLAEYAGREIYPVHRLDRTTGGVMAAAKDPRTAKALSEHIAEGRLSKEYLAVVRGVPAEKSGVLEDDLFFDRRADKSFVVGKSGRKGVKHAVLSYEVLKSVPHGGGEISLVKIVLGTGRTHQIRVQMAHAGHPLLGDGKYGGGNDRAKSALFSTSLKLDCGGDGAWEKALSDGITAEPSGYPWELFK